MARAPDDLFLTGPDFEQKDDTQILVTPRGSVQMTLAEALAAASGSVTEVDVAAGPFLAAGTITTTGTVQNSVGSLTAHGVVIGANASPVTATAAMGNAQLLVGQSAADPLPKAVGGDVTMNNLGQFALVASGVTAGTYGDATHVGQFQVDAAGRLLAAASVAITGIPASAINVGTTTIGGGTTGRVLYDNAGVLAELAVTIVPAGGSIQTAIDGLPSTGGMVILTPDTTYTITTAISSSKTNVYIWAPTWGTVVKRDATLAAAFDLLTLSGAGCRVSNFTIDGNSVVHTGFELVLSGANALADRMQVINSAGSGHVRIREDGCRVTGCTITGLGTALSSERGYGVMALDNKSVKIDDNTITGCCIEGIAANGACLVDSNTVSGCHQWTGDEGGQISYYEIEATPPHGHGAIYSNNRIGQGGVKASGFEIDGNDVTVTNNVIQDCYIYGILHFWGAGCVFTGNKIRNCCLTASYDGISFVAGTQGFTCNDNTVIDDQTIATIRNAIRVNTGSSDNYTIVGNNLTTRGSTPLVDNGAGLHKVIENNKGVQDVTGSIASSATLTLPTNPVFALTGSVAVTQIVIGILPLNKEWTAIPDGAVVFTAGGNIANTMTCVANVPVTLTYSQSKIFVSLSGAAGAGSVTSVIAQGGPFLTNGTITASGTITNSVTSLTASALLLGAGASAVTALGSLGTTTTVLHGNAAGAPTFGAVSLSGDVTGLLPFANLATLAASSLFGNGAITGATGGNIAIGANLTLSVAGTLSASAPGAGSVTSVITAAGPFLANTTITSAGTITGSTTTLTNHGVLVGAAAAAPTALAVGASGSLLLGITGADPAFAAMSGDASITNAGVLNLTSIVATATVGSASLIPVITYDTKGRITATTTAAVPVTAAGVGAVLNSGTVSINNSTTLTGTAAGTVTIAPTTGTSDVILNMPASGGTVTVAAAPSFARQRCEVDIKQGATAGVVTLNSGFVFGTSGGPTSYTATATAAAVDRLMLLSPDGTKWAVMAIAQGFTV